MRASWWTPLRSKSSDLGWKERFPWGDQCRRHLFSIKRSHGRHDYTYRPAWLPGDKHAHNILVWERPVISATRRENRCKFWNWVALAPFNSADALLCTLAFLSASRCWPFPPPSSFLVSIVSLDPIYCCVCSFVPRSFFSPYQLFARWWVCESCLIYSGVESRAGQETSTGYSLNVCVCGMEWESVCFH